MIVISFVNQKGGVGKTTLTLCTAFELAKKGGVLVIDADPQASIMDWSDIRQEPLPHGVSIAAMAKKTVHRDLPALAKGYDFVLIDSPPRATDVSRSVIMASDMVVIPCQPSPYDVWASEESIELVRQATIYKPSIRFAFVLNRKIAHSCIGRDVKEAITSLGDDINLFNSEITQRLIFAEAASHGKVAQEIDREGKATAEIKVFVDELIIFLEKKGRVNG